tara:strand:+ start:1861 stop:2685 length:825 start_codon:yes stop_codon:yes gene_type:complete
MAKDFSISPNTLKLYLRLACEQGYLVKEKTGYRAIDFFTIVKIFCKKHELQLHQHNILAKKTINFKKVLSELEIALFHDSLLVPQFKYANLDSISPNVFKKANSCNVAADSINAKSQIISSVRQISNKFGYGHQKSAKILGAKSHLYSSQTNFKYFSGCTHANMERLREEYPGAVVVPFPKSDSIKVCFGSTMTCSRQKKTYRSFGVDMNFQKGIMMAERLLRISTEKELGKFKGFNQSQIESMMVKSKTGTKNLFFKSILSKRWNGISNTILA